MTDKIVVLSTCETLEEARRIASHLVENRLAACVNILPGVLSVYRWKGAIERAEEFLLLIKSTRECFEELSSELARVHSYEVPEAIAIPVLAGLSPYLEWLDRQVGPPKA